MRYKDFPYLRQVRRIRDSDRVILLLFDDTPDQVSTLKEIPDHGNAGPCRYTGKIGGIQARITFTSKLQYFVSTQSKEQLSTVYNMVLDRLLGIDNSDEHGQNGNNHSSHSARTLAEAL